MSETGVVCCVRVAPLTAFLCAALLPLSAYAAQPTPQPTQTPAVMSTTERLAELERDVTRLKDEFGLREEVSRLRKELEDRSTPKTFWVEVAPWAALGLVGIGFAIAWGASAWKKPVESITLNDLASRLEPLIGEVGRAGAKITAVEKQLSDVNSKIGVVESRISDANANTTELWKLLATGGATGVRDRDPRA